MEEIKITDISGVKVGQVEDIQAARGCSVVIVEKGATAGVDVRGGDRRQMRIVTDLVVSHDTVTDTGLEERDRFLQWFHELLVREYPARRYGWKITPTIVLTETGGTIPTHRCA